MKPKEEDQGMLQALAGKINNIRKRVNPTGEDTMNTLNAHGAAAWAPDQTESLQSWQVHEQH